VGPDEAQPEAKVGVGDRVVSLEGLLESGRSAETMRFCPTSTASALCRVVSWMPARRCTVVKVLSPEPMVASTCLASSGNSAERMRSPQTMSGEVGLESC